MCEVSGDAGGEADSSCSHRAISCSYVLIPAALTPNSDKQRMSTTASPSPQPDDDGTSCDIKSLVSVQFPGVVQDVSKFLPMIGGLSTLQKVYNSRSDRLELRFRPHDVYSHAVYGDKVLVYTVFSLSLNKVTAGESGPDADPSEAKDGDIQRRDK